MPPLTHGNRSEPIPTYELALHSVIYLQAHAPLQTQAAPSPPLCGQPEHAPAPATWCPEHLCTAWAVASLTGGPSGSWPASREPLRPAERATVASVLGPATGLPFLQLLSQPTQDFTQPQEQKGQTVAFTRQIPNGCTIAAPHSQKYCKFLKSSEVSQAVSSLIHSTNALEP